MPRFVERDFAAAGPNELWVADITCLRCWEGVVLFSFILDAYSRRVVGWQRAATCAPRSRSTRCGWRCTSAGPTPTSRSCIAQIADRQYISIDHNIQTLADHGVLASAGSVGDAYDNTLAESCVDSLETERIADRVRCSRRAPGRWSDTAPEPT